MQVMRQEKLQVQVMMEGEEVDRHYLQEVDRQDRGESHIQHRGGREHQP